MRFAKSFVAAAVMAMAAGVAQADTVYDCKEKDAGTNPQGASVAVFVITDSGEAYGMDKWSYDDKDPSAAWPANVRRNDANALFASWTTKRLRASNAVVSRRLEMSLQIDKTNMTHHLRLSGDEVVEQHLAGHCVKSIEKG